ncbi:MAG: hypothetical protein KatS3mg055_1191 [Chloroflexus sp.]|nr:MAG: hypothetical protein KatS3mg055_1191 [Chloroflexus sp.]
MPVLTWRIVRVCRAFHPTMHGHRRPVTPLPVPLARIRIRIREAVVSRCRARAAPQACPPALTRRKNAVNAWSRTMHGHRRPVTPLPVPLARIRIRIREAVVSRCRARAATQACPPALTRRKNAVNAWSPVRSDAAPPEREPCAATDIRRSRSGCAAWRHPHPPGTVRCSTRPCGTPAYRCLVSDIRQAPVPTGVRERSLAQAGIGRYRGIAATLLVGTVLLHHVAGHRADRRNHLAARPLYREARVPAGICAATV